VSPSVVDLPEPAEGWASVLMGEIAQVIGGGTPPAKDPTNFCEEGGFPWLTPADLSGFTGTMVARGARNLTDHGLRRSSARLLPPGTVLMSSRAPIGYLAIAANSIATNQGFKSFVLPPGVEPRYVLLWLRFIQPLLKEMGSGSTFAEISGAKAREIPLLLAPVAEQLRIVEKVEVLLERVSRARQRLVRVPRLLKRFRQVVLAAACEGRLTADWRDARHGDKEAGDWVHASLGDLCSLVTSGSRGWAKYYADSGALFIRAQDINTDELSLHGIAHVRPPQGSEGARTRVMQFDILVTITGANVTKTALVRDVLPEAYVSQHVALVRLADAELAPWVHLWLVSPGHGRRQLLDLAYGAGKPGLNLDNVREVSIRLPPRDEQAEITERVRVLFSLADVIERRISGALAQTEKLPQAILSRAFAGELVPTEAELTRSEGRCYETGEELLARVRRAPEMAGRRGERKLEVGL
jgi:type I restriction enzyme S subunit